jgi:hypothetical protein
MGDLRCRVDAAVGKDNDVLAMIFNKRGQDGEAISLFIKELEDKDDVGKNIV